MQKKLVIRIITDVAIFIFAAVGLWWVVYPIGIFGSLRYRRFYELLISGIVLDVIYSAPRARLFNFQYLYTLIAVVIFLVIIILKTKVRKDIWQKTF